ncbi:hypothetical protein N9H21_02575 [bacterium]|nr:hypothetical protein [bacterium]
MKPPLLGKLTAVGAALLLTLSANAATVNFNVNDYDAGTDVTNAVAGVTIERYIHQYPSPNIDLNPAHIRIKNCDPNVGSFYIDDCQVKYLDLYGNNNEFVAERSIEDQTLSLTSDFSGVSFTFEQEVRTLDIEGWHYFFAGLLFFSFDQNGQYLNYGHVAGGAYPSNLTTCFQSAPVGCDRVSNSLNFDGEGVYQIMLGAPSSVAYFTSFSAQTIPIPTTAWLFGSALAGLLAAKKRNSQPLPQC